MAVLWLFFGGVWWCAPASKPQSLATYVACTKLMRVFSVSREVRVVFLLGCEPAFLRGQLTNEVEGIL